jgi:hypothetical protein
VRPPYEMLIYPDSSDLIDFCTGKAWLDVSDLARRLAAHSHRIVLSLETLLELTALPLRNGHLLEVRKDLNRLEEVPHTFVNEARILTAKFAKPSTLSSKGGNTVLRPSTPSLRGSMRRSTCTASLCM